LDEFETFFNFQKVRNKYRENIFKLFLDVKKLYVDTVSIVVIGELFGGVYPHPDVPDIGEQPLQKGVYYTSDMEFYAFDIQIVSQEGTLQLWITVKQ